MKKYQKYIIGALIGIIAFPTLTLGGSFTYSLIQGKGVPEALEILSKQIDSLTDRIEGVEATQDNQQEIIDEQQEVINKQQELINRLEQGETKRQATIQKKIDKLYVQIEDEKDRMRQCFAGTAYTASNSSESTPDDPNGCLRYQRTIDNILLPKIQELEQSL